MQNKQMGTNLWRGLLVVFGLFMMASGPYAYGGICRFKPGSGTAQVSFSIPNTISISPSTANGTLLHTVNASIWSESSIKCSLGNFKTGVKGERGTRLYSGILPFGDSGLGYKLYSGGSWDEPYPKTLDYSLYTSNNKLEIYKIGKINSFTVPAGVFAHYDADSLVMYVASLAGEIRVEQGSCDVPGITVPMGEYLVSDFEAPGLTVGTRDFMVKLENCSAGINKVNYMLDGVNGNYFPDSGVIKLGAGSASGVGVQIKRNGLPVPLGTWLTDLAVPSKGSNSYTFSAAYYQVDKKVTVGEANTSMRITVRYL